MSLEPLSICHGLSDGIYKACILVMSLRALSQINTDKMLRQPPTLTLIVPPEVDYGMTLQQTKLVYAQLLADKHSKLYQGLLERKAEYDAKCTELSAQDKDRALEFGVRAQEAINNLCSVFRQDLDGLRQDYQEKLNRMYEQLDVSSRQGCNKQSEPSVDYTIYPHK